MKATVLRASMCAIAAASFAMNLLEAQATTATPRRVYGVVNGPGSRPLDAANVFIIETLEGVVTHDDGRFSIATGATGPVTLIVHRVGLAQQGPRLPAPPTTAREVMP